MYHDAKKSTPAFLLLLCLVLPCHMRTSHCINSTTKALHRDARKMIPLFCRLASRVTPIHQFNHQSTRGHCIMTLEVEMPHPDMAGMKQKGRVYVCDLAGTEPAGDVVYALYDKKVTCCESCFCNICFRNLPTFRGKTTLLTLLPLLTLLILGIRDDHHFCTGNWL